MRSLVLLSLCLSLSLSLSLAATTTRCPHGLGDCHSGTTSVIPFLHTFPSNRRAKIQEILGATYANVPPTPAVTGRGQSTAPHVFRPTDYGADPSGVEDSTEGVFKAVDAMLSSSSSSSRRSRRGSNGPSAMAAVSFAAVKKESDDDVYTDLKGAVLDLSGGKFVISKGIVIPPGQPLSVC
jgi:hypothetical protein